MSTHTVVPKESVTTTLPAGDWREHAAFCFVQQETYSATFSDNVAMSAVPVGDLLDEVALIEAAEDDIDVRLGRAALSNPGERPAIPWSELKQRT